MLIEHRTDDVDERLITRKEAVSSGQQVALKPTLAHVLAQHFHDAAVGAEIGIDRLDIGHPFLPGDFVNRFQPVRCGLVRAKQPKILLAEIELHHITQKRSEHPRCFGPHAAGYRHRHGVVVEVGHR